MIEKQNGISLINIILVICIIICIFILVWIFNNNEQAPNIYKGAWASNTGNSNSLSSISSNNSNANVDQTKITLNNSIFGESGNYENESNNEAKRYYYRQLNSIGKSMYDTIVNNIYKFVDGYGTIEFSVNDSTVGGNFQTVWDAVSLDRPDWFWVDTQKVSLVTTTTTFWGKTKYKYTLEPKEGGSYFIDYFDTSSEVRVAKSVVEQIVNNIVEGARGSTFDKVRYVHDELVNRVSYNQESYVNNSNIYGALAQNKCVCEGYAEAFKYILDKMDIPCVTIYGTGIDNKGASEAHAWNYVKMENGSWYAVDVTWDDPIIIGNGKLTDKSRYRHFLKGSDSFFTTHIEDGDVSKTGQAFKYPVLSKNDY